MPALFPMDVKIASIKYSEEYILNSEGMKLFTCSWVPKNFEPKALIFLCHCFGMECSISMKGAATRLAKAGYAVYGMDNRGHGKSEGLSGYVSSFDDLVSDCSDHFTSICEKKENKRKLRILMGESMGGAMVLRLHRKKPDYWDGAILLAPMCKIADELKPYPIIVSMLKQLNRLIPTWKMIPLPDVINLACRDPKKRKEVRANPYIYNGLVRLQTGYELLNVSLDLEKRLHEVTLPFFVGHGGDDKVTDPLASKLLYESASSSDKTFKSYPGMWHSLSYGEFPDSIDIVFSDIFDWLHRRIALENLRLEREGKLRNDVFSTGRLNKLSSED